MDADEWLRDHTQEIVTRILKHLGDQIELIALFGSAATGTTHPLSDIDIGVLVDAPPENWTTMRMELLSLFDMTERPHIDVILLNGTSLTLQFRVIRDGRPLYQKQPRRWEKYVEYVLQRYPDWAIYIRNYFREAVGV
ncbi:MAG: type VII toxin-antitoxin system MntA family adenylyltransferase antitoxin [Candidatus Thorarchaeota archaeon]